MADYRVPSATARSELIIEKSRFISTVARANTVQDARAILTSIRAEMPDASHHVYAFRVGYGSSVTDGMSDDGEPTGTAGPPVMAVLRGADVGDTLVVVTRYFGGTKLGTGGLVRAYTDAAKLGLQSALFEQKIEKRLLGIDVPYALYERVKLLIGKYHGVLQEETFGAEVTVLAAFPVSEIAGFSHDLSELSAGRLQAVVLD